MPSPDVVRYASLELLSVDAQSLIDNALAALQTTFPDWTPREGNTELVLLEQIAQLVEEDVYALNQLPNSVTEALLRLFGLNRDQGAPPTAQVTFTFVDAAAHTVPEGTTVRLNLGDGVDPVDFVTDADLVVAAGPGTGTVSTSASVATVAANGKAAGTILELIDAIPYIATVTLAAAAAGGREPEDGDDFLDRGIPLLARLTTTLVRPVDVTNYIAQAYPAAVRIRVLDLYDSTDPNSAPGRSPGFVTVAVAGAGGSSLGSARDTIAADVRNHMHAGLAVTVVDADVTPVDVKLTVLRYASADPTATQQAVAQALTDYLNPDTWEWGGVVYVNELIARADAAEGVDVVLSIDVPATDLTLGGWAPLPRAGTLTITVVDAASIPAAGGDGGSGGGTGDGGSTTPVLDPLITGANSGVLTLFDLANPASWVKQAAPADGDTVVDLATGAASYLIAVPTGPAPTFAGGGFDYTGITHTENVVKAPAGALAPIKASANQYFTVCTYLKIPAAWNLPNSYVTLFCSTDTDGGYSVEPDLLTLVYAGLNAAASIRQTRPKSGSTPAVAEIDLVLTATVLSPHRGKVAQIAYFRNGTGRTLRVRSSAGATYLTGNVGVPNTAEFGASRARWGAPVARTDDDTYPNAVTAMRLYRGWIESLDVSGREPVSVLDADYDRNIGRFT